MFERFTDAARQVMADAKALAHEQRSPAIRRHHLLYALLEDAEERPDAVPALMLADAQVDPAAFKVKVLESLKESEASLSDEARGEFPFSSGAKKAIELALREALSLGHNYIGADHLLLAILRSADGPLARTIEATTLRYGTAREFLRTYSPPQRGRRGRGGPFGDEPRMMRREVRQVMRGRRSHGVEHAMEHAFRRAGRDRALNTGDLLVAMAEGRATHFRRLMEGVVFPEDLAARADRLVADNVPDGEPEAVRVDPRSGSLTVSGDLADKLKDLPPEKIAEALRKLAED